MKTNAGRLQGHQVVMGPVLSPAEVMACVGTAQILCRSMCDRQDLHERGMLERFHDVLMGEVAEQSVIKWLRSRDIEAESAVDKAGGQPDSGHDILVKGRRGEILKCSVKSSISAYYADMDKILDTFSIATKASEICSINIQVYFWLNLRETPRTAVPSERHMAIVGWLGSRDFSGRDFVRYARENREVADIRLRELRAMETLPGFLKRPPGGAGPV